MGLVISLHGPKGSGKDQFYTAIRSAFPDLRVKKVAFADPIKDEVCRIFGLADEAEYDLFKRTDIAYNLPNLGPRTVSGRQIVREIGMMLRTEDEQRFVRYVQEKIASEPDTVWCITDLRFDNELQAIRESIGGVVVKIRRGGVKYDGHVTETEIADDACDVVIHNDHITLEEYNRLAIEEFKNIMEVTV